MLCMDCYNGNHGNVMINPCGCACHDKAREEEMTRKVEQSPLRRFEKPKDEKTTESTACPVKP